MAVNNQSATLTHQKILRADQSCGDSHFWDPVEARFTTCFLPYASAIPAAIAVCILLGRILKLLIPFRPRWTKAFVVELEEPSGEHEFRANRVLGRQTAALLTISLMGCLLQVWAVESTNFKVYEVYLAVAWAIAFTLVVIDRPRSPSVSLIMLYGTIVLSQLILLVHMGPPYRRNGIVKILGVFMGLGAIAFILFMTMRDPELLDDQISPAFSTPTHQLRSPEDKLTLWQFLSVSWMSPLISVGKERQLNDEDVWSLSYEFQHRRLHDNFRELRGSVIGRLIKANAIDLILTSFLGIIELLANFSAPLLLQQLLLSMENPNASRSAAVTYAVLSMAVRLVAAQCGVLILWFSRRAYERSRGEMITMLYEKTLARKIIGVQPAEDAGDVKLPEAVHISTTTQGEDQQTAPKTIWDKFRHYLPALAGLRARLFKRGSSPEVIKEPASMGKILNLMRNDVYEVAQRFWEFQQLITKPLGLIFSIVLIWKFIGWPCLIGVLTVLVGQGVNALLARVLMKWEKTRRAATDIKLQKISQFVEAIRHLRWYGWQDTWRDKIMEARQHELNIRIITSLWSILIGFTNQLSSNMFPVLVFYAYTALARQPLRIDIAFPALQLFTMLETNLAQIPNLITVLLNASVAMGRINDFMNEPDKDEISSSKATPSVAFIPKNGKPSGSVWDSEISSGSSSWSRSRIELIDASFAWPGRSKNVLHGITLRFPIGLTVVCGEVAAGKSALLQAILGELDEQGGEFFRPNEMVGYCAQTPWLQTMSIRENILFASPYEETRYNEVLDACALIPDMANFKDGDLSEIGENGIGLSGGQKARVALARALYSKASLLLLDDPLSALDQSTAETIVQRCFGGALLHGCTTILVTHRTDLCSHLAEQIIEISEGRARIQEPRLSSSTSSRTLPNDDTEATSSGSLPQTPVTEASHLGEDQILEINPKPDGDLLTADTTREDDAPIQVSAEPEKFIEEEHRAHGGVKASIYWEYIKAGKVRFWLVLIFILALFRLVNVAKTWFLKSWGEAYNKPNEQISSNPLDGLPSPDDNVRPWLIGFLLLGIAQAIMFLIAHSFMVIIVYTAGRKMFKDVLENVANATFRFYDITPIGRLMNRLTSDISTIDGNISRQIQMFAFYWITWISSLIVIASVTPGFLIFSFVLTVAFVLIFMRFLPASQSLRRLEMVSLSPLMSNFGALLNGLTTVRAFCAQSRFQDRVIVVTDNFQKMDHFYWSLQAWLMYRFDALSASSTFILTLLALYTGVSPGLTAFVLIAASTFVSSTHWLCKQYGQLQMDFVSVERVVELLHVEKEPAGPVTPPAWWPTLEGDIVFENVTIRYAPHLDPSLSDLSFKIRAGSNTAIVGRTGSGKSTLALSLLATVLPSAGRILIDNIDISTVHKNSLRRRVTFLAQDPVLFPGTMRQNLDPLEEYTDAACEAVLLKIAGRHEWKLTTHVDTGGQNLSQGQRQLVGLARALLRRSAIIILDEATASIDMETSMWIQEVLQEEMKGSTVITIAHRIEAVKNADFAIVLDKGRVVEEGRAEDLLRGRK